MTIEEEIRCAFGRRPKPKGGLPPASAAARILEREWTEVDWEDFSSDIDLFHELSPSQFKYYLPGIMMLAVKHPAEWFMPVDSLIGILDRGLDPPQFDDFILPRLSGLTREEYGALREWLLFLANCPQYCDDDCLLRCLRTVDQLEARGSGSEAR